MCGDLACRGSGWGEDIEFLGLAFYRGSVAEAERVLEEFEKRLDEVPVAAETPAAPEAGAEWAVARDRSAATATPPGAELRPPVEKEVPVTDAEGRPTGTMVRLRWLQPLQVTAAGDLYAHAELPGWGGEPGQMRFLAGGLILGSAPIKEEEAMFLRAAPAAIRYAPAPGARPDHFTNGRSPRPGVRGIPAGVGNLRTGTSQ